MNSTPLRPLLLSFACLILLFSLSCQRELTPPGDIDIDIPEPNVTVTASVSGRITSGNVPVAGVQIQAGTRTTTTDANGTFTIEDARVLQQTAVVTAKKNGYFTGVRTFVAHTNATNFIEIELLEKERTGYFPASSGANVALPGGSTVSFTPGSFTTEAGTAYTGMVSVYAQYLSPDDEDLSRIMPGDLRGIDADGEITGMITYGMMAVEITGDAGEKLLIATGKKAVLDMPISAKQLSNAPASIPLWYFDETTGLWKEEGAATKQSGRYIGDVSHFSYWNCDIPADFVYFNVVLKDQNENPLPYTRIRLSNQATGATATGITDAEGLSRGWIPKGAALKLEVLNKCNDALLTQEVGPFQKEADMGTITVTLPENMAVTISGTVQNCLSADVEEGLVQITVEGLTYVAKIEGGTFSAVVPRCTAGPTEAVLVAVDNSGAQPVLSDEKTITVTSGAASAGVLEACGEEVAEFVYFKLDGTDYDYLVPIDSVSFYSGDTSYTIYASRKGATQQNLQISWRGTPTTGTHPFDAINFYSESGSFYARPQSSLNVNITAYGAVGSFVEGNFSGTVAGDTSRPTANVQLSFKVKRKN